MNRYKDIFNLLKNPTGENLFSVFRIADSCYIAKDLSNNFSLVIEHSLQSDMDWPKPRKTNTLHFVSGRKVTFEIEESNQNQESFVTMITCTEKKVIFPFCAMIEAALSDESIVREMVNDPNQIWLFLEDFYDCFSNKKSNYISKRQTIGLWGELSTILAGKVTHGIIETWKGPEKYIHDFAVNRIALDVKTTTNRTRIHKIKHEQLFDNTNTKKYIVSYTIAKTHNEGKSVDHLVEEISDRLNPIIRLKFVNKLGLIGYNFKGEHPECIIKYRLRSGGKMYSSEALPHINEDDIPDGVNGLEYSITLDNLQGLLREAHIQVDRQIRGLE